MSEQLAVATNIIVLGRGGGVNDAGQIELGEMGKLRVDATANYIGTVLAHHDNIRVQFTGGWAAGMGQRRPSDQYDLVSELMIDYAYDEEPTEIFWKKPNDITTSTLRDTYSTMSEAVRSAQSEFFGPRKKYVEIFSEENPLGVVAQARAGAQPTDEDPGNHMGRGIRALMRTYRLPRQAFLPIIADGFDEPETGITEDRMTALTEIGFKPFRSDAGLLIADRAMIAGSLAMQDIHNIKDLAVSPPWR